MKMNKTISEYIELIIKWARDRELDTYGTVKGQRLRNKKQKRQND